MKTVLPLLVLSMVIASCASRPVLPETTDVKVAREAPPKKCTPQEKVTGQTRKVSEGAQAALDDLKREAAAKGFNYVQILQYSEGGTAVTGMGYICP